MQAAQPPVSPAVGGFTEMLAEQQATPAEPTAAALSPAKPATGTNDSRQAALQPVQTSLPDYLGKLPFTGAASARAQTVPDVAASTETNMKQSVERGSSAEPPPPEGRADTPTIVPPTPPAPTATAQTAKRAISQPAATQAGIVKDDLATVEQQHSAVAPAAERDDRKARTETKSQDQAAQNQAQPPLPSPPIVTAMAPAHPLASTVEASSGAPKEQVEAVSGHRAIAASNADQQQAEPIAASNAPMPATPAVVVSPQPAPHTITPARATPESPALQQAVGKAAETVAAQVGRAVQDGTRVLTMQLHPAELGRVEVRLSFHDAGIGVQMTVDRPETYDAFARNRSAMEQHLANSGVNLTTGGLDLRFGQQPDRGMPQPSMHTVRVPLSGEAASSELPPRARFVRDGLVDILA